MKRVVALLLGLGLTALVCACVAGGPWAEPDTAPTPEPTVEPTPGPTAAPTPEPVPAPTPEPAPTPGAEPDQDWDMGGEGYDYSQPVPLSEAVEEDYFADAAFVGDSRTDGFRLYSGLTQGEFIVKTGMSVFKLDTDQVNYHGEKLTVLEALGRKSYGKIYLSIGVNELGQYDDQGYYDHYAQLVDDIRAQQPQALIYVQLIIPVNAQKCKEKNQPYYVTNEQIAVYNSLLLQLVQDKRVLLLDPGEALTDETLQPPYDTVTDGVHFTKPTYRLWLDYLKTHTIERGETT